MEVEIQYLKKKVEDLEKINETLAKAERDAVLRLQKDTKAL